MIRIEQSDLIGLGLAYRTVFTQNTIFNNNNFQLLAFGPNSYYRGSLVHLVSEDQVVMNIFEFRSNTVYSCKAIGPETSLIYLKYATYVEIR